MVRIPVARRQAVGRRASDPVPFGRYYLLG